MKSLGVIALIFLQVILANADEHDHKVRVVLLLFCKSVNGLCTKLHRQDCICLV